MATKRGFLPGPLRLVCRVAALGRNPFRVRMIRRMSLDGDFHHGPYQSEEGLNDEFTHGLIMLFDSAESRDAYFPWATPRSVPNMVSPCPEKVVALDFVRESKIEIL